jgi:hypothetical protein
MKINQVINSVKILVVGDELFDAGGRTDGQRGMTRFIVALRHMAKAPRPAVPYSNSVRTWDCELVLFIGYNVSSVGGTRVRILYKICSH